MKVWISMTDIARIELTKSLFEKEEEVNELSNIFQLRETGTRKFECSIWTNDHLSHRHRSIP